MVLCTWVTSGRGGEVSVSPDPVSNTRVNSTDLPMLLRRRIRDSSSSRIDLRCSFPNGRCSPIRISPEVTIQTTLRSNRAAPSRRHPNNRANSAAMPSHWSFARWARPGSAIRHTTMAMPARTSRSLSDVPLRNLTSFSFAAAAIAGGRHHDRPHRVKRQRMRLNHDYVVGSLPSRRSDVRLFDVVSHGESAAKRRATRLGGIPAGSWRLLGRSGTQQAGNSARGLAVVGDHADLLGTLGAAIHHPFTRERRTGVAMGAGLNVLGRQGGKGRDGAERDDEKAEG